MLEDKTNRVLEVIQCAGGQIVGRTRLQKIVCLLELADKGYGFSFDYHHFGPYSEELANAIATAVSEGKISEEEHTANWGGGYSIYKASSETSNIENDPVKTQLIKKTARENSIVLELAATAVFLAKKNTPNPWKETEQRKYEKAQGGRLDQAKLLYADLRTVAPNLPEINS